MEKTQFIENIIGFLFISLIILFSSAVVYAGDPDSKTLNPEGVSIELTKEFYESLIAQSRGNNRLYSNDPSLEYLKEISVSSRFIVETNLHILKNQERLIRLLDTLLDDKKK